jgi:heme oxygenase
MNQTEKQDTPIDRLKAGIWDIHEGVSADNRDTASSQESVMKGNLPLFKYVNNLKQRYILQREFEKVLGAHYRQNPFLSTVVTDEQFHADKSAQDLRFFNVDPATVQPLPATTEMVEFFHATARRDPRLILAIHYVIEGSNNGAFMIARSAKKSYNLEGTDGTFHLQPYGDQIREKWGRFRTAFNTLPIDDQLMDDMIKVGRATFRHMNKVGDQAHALPEENA